MADFYVILTKAGSQLIAQAHINGIPVQITKMSVGDSNGTYYEPDQNQTALVNELIKKDIDVISIDENNPNWIVAECLIPADHSGYYPFGFYVREVGIWEGSGILLAVGKMPEQYKPLPIEGATRDLIVRAIMQVSNPEDVTLSIDPNAAVAGRSYVDGQLQLKLTTGDMFNDFTLTGYTASVPDPLSLVMTMNTGVAYIKSYRIAKLGTDPDLTHTYPPSKDIYVDINKLAQVVWVSVPNGDPPPPISIDSCRMMRVVTNSEAIVSIQDIRNMKVELPHNLKISGDLEVAGTSSWTHSTNTYVTDKNIEVNVGGTGNTGSAEGSGLTVAYDVAFGSSLFKVVLNEEFVWTMTDLNVMGSVSTNKTVAFGGERFMVIAKTYVPGTGTRLTLDRVYPSASATNVTMYTDSDLAQFVYDSTIPSHFKLGITGTLYEVLTARHTQIVYNKTQDDSTYFIMNTADNTRKGRILAGNIATGQTKDYYLPSLSGSSDILMVLAEPQTMSNKSFQDQTTFFIDEVDATKKMRFEVGTLNTGVTRVLSVPTNAMLSTDDTLVTLTAIQVIINKTFTDNVTHFQDDVDTTKKLEFQVSSVQANRTAVLSIPNTAADTICVLALAQTLTNKTLSSPTITSPGVTGGTFSNPALTGGVDATKDGSEIVTKAMYGSGNSLDADLLDGHEGSWYRNADNLNAGTIPLARIPATLTGKDADTLDTHEGSWYQNANNLNAGTIPLARIPATLTGKDADTLDGSHKTAIISAAIECTYIGNYYDWNGTILLSQSYQNAAGLYFPASGYSDGCGCTCTCTCTCNCNHGKCAK
jgi:hypothetical protein